MAASSLSFKGAILTLQLSRINILFVKNVTGHVKMSQVMFLQICVRPTWMLFLSKVLEI
jgi:hypothetical protein